MTINNQDNVCLRCQNREKFLETYKKCFYCTKKHCQLCWKELQISDDYKTLMDILPKTNQTNQRRICSICVKTLLEHTLRNFELKKHDENTKNDDDEEYQLALALSLSQCEVDEKMRQKRKLDQEKESSMKKINLIENTVEDKYEILLEKTTDAIQRFMNRAKSNYERNRDVISDTALLSTFITLQTFATDLEQLKHHLDHQRQHFERLQEKLTALRDAREALNILRYENQEKKRKEQEHLDKQRRLIMMEKVADLRQLKRTQIVNFQENYFQRLLEEEQQMTERLQRQKLFKQEQFGS